jgi:hypothetical protein
LLWKCEILLQEEKMTEQDGGDQWNEKLKSFNRIQQELGGCVVKETRLRAVAEKEDGDVDVGHQGVPNIARSIRILNTAIVSQP